MNISPTYPSAVSISYRFAGIPQGQVYISGDPLPSAVAFFEYGFEFCNGFQIFGPPRRPFDAYQRRQIQASTRVAEQLHFDGVSDQVLEVAPSRNFTEQIKCADLARLATCLRELFRPGL